MLRALESHCGSKRAEKGRPPEPIVTLLDPPFWPVAARRPKDDAGRAERAAWVAADQGEEGNGIRHPAFELTPDRAPPVPA